MLTAIATVIKRKENYIINQLLTTEVLDMMLSTTDCFDQYRYSLVDITSYLIPQ